ncbi:hypothetical protein RIF29_11178 [Crotalaria pallida]|uniref:Polymerase nucleotidyl transferase domain-containing protein n=1 Tax=Crotalaria pallida TaxID=3830 RepID=A0AAN9P0J1_CROPI
MGSGIFNCVSNGTGDDVVLLVFFARDLSSVFTAMKDAKQKHSRPSSSTSNQKPLSLDKELWLFAEERAQEILCVVQPNVLSEANRKEVMDYVMALIRGYYGAEVFPFGSVPLKTYLPDGDIDFTVLSHETRDEDAAQAVRNILECHKNVGYLVKDIQHIRAQVQVVKCTVNGLAVDISFNQMAGLYALHFLEAVDQLLGRDHLLKRSIILIKAWLYYESRILGAHHGLLSTYAVEVLVLYIINRFHSSVHGPLEVLYKFLDYYSKFDWDTNYISIDGPKALSTLPEIVESPECDRAGFLLSREFLNSYRDMCFVQARASETKTNEFPTKFMNISDPLKSNNNLGRSVSKGSFQRIKMALSYGARKLKEILMGENMGAALEHYFKITLDRNGKGTRPDVGVPVAVFGTGRSEESDLRGDCDGYYGVLQYVEYYDDYAMPPDEYTNYPSSPSLADMHAIPTYYHPMDTNLYIPGQTHYHPNAPHATYYLQENVPGPTLYHPTTVPQETYCLQENVTGSTFYHPNTSHANEYLEENIPTQIYDHPMTPKSTNSVEKKVISRGTGSYIPDLTHTWYRDMHGKGTKPRRFNPMNHNTLPKSPLGKQPVEVEVHSEAETNDKSRSFELANEDFPVLPRVRLTSPREAQEAVKLTEKVRSSSSSELNFGLSYKPFLPSTRETTPSKSEGSVKLVDKERSSSLPILKIELNDEEFPLLPSVSKTIPSKSQESVKLTEQAKHSSPPELSIVLSNEEFPPLSRIHKAGASGGRESVKLIDQARNSFSSQLNNELSKDKSSPVPNILKITTSEGQKTVTFPPQAKNFSASGLKIEFGTLTRSKSLTEQSLPTKSEKEGSGVSSSQVTMLAVPKVAKECTDSDDDRSWIDSI